MYKIKQDVYHTATLGGRDANKIPYWSGWKVKMFECDCLPWFLLLFCIDQTIMLLSLSLTHTHTYAHIHTHTNTTTTSPSQLVYCICSTVFDSTGQQSTSAATVLSCRLCHIWGISFVCCSLSAQTGMQALSSHWVIPCHTPNNSHLHTCTGARTKTFNVVGLLHDLCLLGLVSDPRCTTEKRFICQDVFWRLLCLHMCMCFPAVFLYPKYAHFFSCHCNAIIIPLTWNHIQGLTSTLVKWYKSGINCFNLPGFWTCI